MKNYDLERLFKEEFNSIPSMFGKRDLLLRMQQTNIDLQKELFKLLTKRNNSQFLLTGVNPKKVAPKPVSKNSELREGFWFPDKRDVKYYEKGDDILSLPFAEDHVHMKAFPKKKAFLEALAKVEKKAKVAHYKGWSTCRICKQPNGSKEYSFKHMTWPSGYRHYIEDHGVWPSPEFRLTILDSAKGK